MTVTMTISMSPLAKTCTVCGFMTIYDRQFQEIRTSQNQTFLLEIFKHLKMFKNFKLVTFIKILIYFLFIKFVKTQIHVLEHPGRMRKLNILEF